MKYDLTSIDGAAAGSLELNDAIFGLEPRADIIARMVRLQLAKRQSGDHKTLGRADIVAIGGEELFSVGYEQVGHRAQGTILGVGGGARDGAQSRLGELGFVGNVGSSVHWLHHAAPRLVLLEGTTVDWSRVVWWRRQSPPSKARSSRWMTSS